MSIMNQDFNQQQYNDKLAQVASLAVTYAKDGTGYHSMKDAFYRQTNPACAECLHQGYPCAHSIPERAT